MVRAPARPAKRWTGALLAAAAVLTTGAPAGAAGSDRFVGKVYRGDPPAGVTTLGGALIGGRYSVSQMKAARKTMLWLERRVSPAGDRTPAVRVLAVLDLPRRRAAEAVAIAVCEVDGRRQRQVVALWPTNRGTGAPARLAWRADGPRKRFARIDPRSVSCPEVLAG